jgi:hypothetical protein
MILDVAAKLSIPTPHPVAWGLKGLNFIRHAIDSSEMAGHVFSCLKIYSYSVPAWTVFKVGLVSKNEQSMVVCHMQVSTG